MNYDVENFESGLAYVSYGTPVDVLDDEAIFDSPAAEGRDLRFDSEKFWANYRSGEKVAKTLAENFNRDLPELIENLDSAFDQWHCGAIQAVAYRVRYAVMPFCTKQISANALSIEQLAKRFELGQATELFQTLRADLLFLAEDLQSLVIEGHAPVIEEQVPVIEGQAS